MQETNYTIKTNGKTFSAYNGEDRLSHGCLTEEDCFHSIWINEGSNFDDFYVSNEDGAVFCVDRGEL